MTARLLESGPPHLCLGDIFLCTLESPALGLSAGAGRPVPREARAPGVAPPCLPAGAAWARSPAAAVFAQAGVYLPNTSSATGSPGGAPAGRGLCPPEAGGTAVPASGRTSPSRTRLPRALSPGDAQRVAGRPGGAHGPWGGFLDVRACLHPAGDRALDDRLVGSAGLQAGGKVGGRPPALGSQRACPPRGQRGERTNRNPGRVAGGEGAWGQAASAWSASGLVSAGAGGHRATVPGCRAGGWLAPGCSRPPPEQKCAKHGECMCTRPHSAYTQTEARRAHAHTLTHAHPTVAGRADGAGRPRPPPDSGLGTPSLSSLANPHRALMGAVLGAALSTGR